MATESAAVEFVRCKRVNETRWDDQVSETSPAKRPERKTLLQKFLKELDFKQQQQQGMSDEEMAWVERYMDWAKNVGYDLCGGIPRYPGGPPPNCPSFGGDPAVQARIKAEAHLKGYVRTAEMAIEFFNKNNLDADYEVVEVISGCTFFHAIVWKHINLKAKPKGASADDDQSVKYFFAEWYADDTDFDGRICKISEGQITVCCLLEGFTKDCTTCCFSEWGVRHPLKGFVAGSLDGLFDGFFDDFFTGSETMTTRANLLGQPSGEANQDATAMPVQARTQQASRVPLRVCVEGLPPTANEQSVATFFNLAMATIGGNTASPGDAVIGVNIDHKNKRVLMEMRSVEELHNAMALNGILFKERVVTLRPSRHVPLVSPSDPNRDLAAVGPTLHSSDGLLGPGLIFVGGIPNHFKEVEIKAILEHHGPLSGFGLMKDPKTGFSKGYAFCVYQDLSVTDTACAHLNGYNLGDTNLIVTRAVQDPSQPMSKEEKTQLLA